MVLPVSVGAVVAAGGRVTWFVSGGVVLAHATQGSFVCLRLFLFVNDIFSSYDNGNFNNFLLPSRGRRQARKRSATAFFSKLTD